MNKFLSILVCLVSFGPVAFTLTGCSPVSPPVAYHSLAGFDLAQNPTGTQGQLAILVGPVSVPDILKSSQIATGTTGGRYQLSEQHRWAGEVNRDFSRAVGEQLAGSLGTEQIAIFPMGQHLTATHQIIFDILTMEGDLGKEASLIVRWSLVEPQSKTVRITRRSAFSEKPSDDGYDAWVTAQRHNITRLSEEIAAAIKAAP
ncbi:MAG: hypothetical protein FD168_452 [Desulfobulbaceae bacterium]|nr:MAG: hypothetical protein FD168_452 [Desulfobulbaceae bacterium]